MDIQTLECDKIEFSAGDESSRSFREEIAEGLAMSIEAEGLYLPIAVRANPHKPGYFRGVQGRHRLHAQHQILGRPTIPCNVLVMDDDEAAIATLAENAFRKALSQAEKSKTLRLWHRMFAAKHPEQVGRGNAGRAAIEAGKGAGKGAKARGGNGASVQKTKLNLATADGKTAAENVVQKTNLGFLSDGSGTAGGLKAHSKDKSAGGKTQGKGHPANFAKTVAAATGCSETTAKRETRVALNLTDEQLLVCQERQLNKGDVDSIAGIQNDAKRAEVIDLIDSGLEFGDAWDRAHPNAKKATGKSREREAAEAAADREQRPELSDDAWFDRFCGEKAALLGSPAGFKADALVFRRITGPRYRFRAEVKGTLNEAKAAKVTGPFYESVERFVSEGHPKDWPLCDGCDGSGVDGGGAGCTTCCGAGYLLKSRPVRPTTVVGGDRAKRTASPVNGAAPSVLVPEFPPPGGRACDGKPGRSDTPDARAADGEAGPSSASAPSEEGEENDWPESD